MPHQRVNAIRIYYETLGQGPPALFLHGLGSSLRGWEFQREPFARRYQVILMDARGHGNSDKPPGPYASRSAACWPDARARPCKPCSSTKASASRTHRGGSTWWRPST